MKRLPMEELYPILEEQLAGGGRCMLPVTGSSMLPALRQGRDAAVLEKRTVGRGDVILYRRENGAFVLHRIVGERGGAWLCCGDNQWQSEAVPRDRVLAAVSAVRRGGAEWSVDRPAWRLWSALWVGLFPLRRPLIALRRLAGNLKKSFRR